MTAAATPSWIDSVLRQLTPRRLRAQAIVLAICLWCVCAVDFATSGPFDRAGNIKFQDFLPVYVASRLMVEHRSPAIYNPQLQEIEKQFFQKPDHVRLPFLYPPQVAWLFRPLTALRFFLAAFTWAVASMLIYFLCVYAIWKNCPNLSSCGELVLLAALAFPPLFHCFIRGQLSALLIAIFTAAYLAFQSRRPFLGGMALGLLAIKPQFLLAIPLVFLLARAWKPFLGLAVSTLTQLLLVRFLLGEEILRAWFSLLNHPTQWISTAELELAPIQMHSLRSFWALLLPWSTGAFAAYALTAILAIAIAAAIWKSAASLALRFSALTLCAVLVNPHLFVYDLLVLAPALLLLLDWTLLNPGRSSTTRLRLLLYLAFILPLFGPISRWTHIQLSVIAFAAILWTLTKLPSVADTQST